jgi:2-methylisocitrate lyase-like PEP mutase family enzyme
VTHSLRELINVPGRALLLPGATNALSAKIVEDLGFEALYLTGAGVTNTELALPDLGFITLDQIATQVGRIRDVVDIPIVVDADTGFGNALNVTQCVRILERNGANAIQLEDQVFPKRCGHFAGKTVASLEEFVTKIKAVVDTRKSEDFLVVARTDALAVADMDEVLRRTEAFEEAGADVIFVEALSTREEITEVPKHVRMPLLINMVEGGKTPLMEKGELEALGYHVILYANSGMRAAILGMQRVLGALKERGSTTNVLDQIASWEERQRLVGKDHFDELEERYTS